MIYFELQEYCEKEFGFNILQATRINRGWLNLKWKMETNQGTFLLKEYNQVRFKLSDLTQLQTTLEIHQKLHTEGISCPRLLTHAGQILHITNNNRRFVMMDFREGDVVKPGKVNEEQIHDLGRQTGKMHRLLNMELSIHNPKPQFNPPSKESRLSHWYNLFRDAEMEDKQWLLPFVELQIKATEAFDYAMLTACEGGLAHRDLWVDNILFHDNRLSAILDFDRLNYDYPELDIARAIISCSLFNDHFQLGNAMAFLNGYRTERDFPAGNLERALRMLWYMESTWWINNNMDQHSVPPARFAEEMLWLSKSHLELKEMFGSM
ncbi:phosphotransferase [Paenibacillus sp. XY044]|uniref:phosphotransferase n=1 Tax=Paenibacillus sp. XY044 TaxID=2026089 RepID=UPI000B998950|nr:phosphotransferase [Paenibacillus sp. XY044]OZB98835.1 homoserine kinase [Paenibacillus sp. XY044]